MQDFRKILKKEISKNKISQNKFAKKIGISSYYLGQLIKGEKKPPSRELQLKMVDELNLNNKEKIIFLNLIAKEKKDIPSDIYIKIIHNEKKWDEIRKLLNKGEEE